MRLGGSLACASLGASLDETSANSQMVSVTVNVPVDFASEAGQALPSQLCYILPGPPKLWTGGDIIGFAMKKARGTFRELKAALQACVFSGTIQYASIVDYRLPNHLPQALLNGRQLKVLHQINPPSLELLRRLEMCAILPSSLCFHYSCASFIHWADKHTAKAAAIECLGDLILRPEGLEGKLTGCTALRPCPSVKKLGLSVTTGRYRCERFRDWASPNTAADLRHLFPNLEIIGLNLEVSYDCDTNLFSRLLDLLQHFTGAGIVILSFEVLLVQLQSNSRKRDERLHSLCEDLRVAGVEMTRPVKTRSTKEFPCDGFAIPASLWLSAPATVRMGISSAVWETVW